MRHFLFSQIFFLILCYPLTEHGKVYFTKEGHAQFTSHSTLEDFTGKSDYLAGRINLADSTFDFYLDLTTLHTGIRLRDEHMHEDYLQDNKYPFASFYGKLVSTFDPTNTDSQEAVVYGEFKVHGVSRQVEIRGKLLLRNGKLHVDASWPLQLQDYKIDIPSFLFLRVNRTINISIQTEMNEQQGL